MKVKELIKILKKYSPELDVMLLADEFLRYYPVEKEKIKEQELWLGHNGSEVARIKEDGREIDPAWREKEWFYDEKFDDGKEFKQDIKEKRKVLTIT